MCAAPTFESSTFESILTRARAGGSPASDATLHDLALDQVVTHLGADAPGAAAAFRTPLVDVEEVEYRQDVFRGLEDARLRDAVEAFLRGVEECARAKQAGVAAHYRYGPELWRLTAVARYVTAVEELDAALATIVPTLAHPSAGWQGLRAHVAAHAASTGFRTLRRDAVALHARLETLDYVALVRGGRVTVAPVGDEPDLGDAVLATFARFRRGAPERRAEPRGPAAMDHVQAWILELVARVHPEPFAQLDRFAADTTGYRDATLSRFADEVRFYLAYLDHLDRLRAAGLPVCYPVVSASRKELDVRDTWDLALAPRLVEQRLPVVTNDLRLAGPERILVISGPNQGGKTTTARTFGQLHHLAAIGCPVPGRTARILLCDRVLTVFERPETSDTAEGRLGAEIARLHDVLDAATGRTVLVVNEAFASTALHDARILTRDVLRRIGALDALAVCVTFIDELSRLDETTVSMVSSVDPADPTRRTFRVERRPADGRAYARALAARHGLTLDQVARRLGAEAAAREVAS